jgi:putative flippase GtrA
MLYRNRLLQRAGINQEKAQKFVKFGLVGGFGTLLNTAILWALHSGVGLHYLLAAAIATEAAIISNFLGNHYFTFKDSTNKQSTWKKFGLFQSISVFTIIGTLAILWALVTLFGEALVLLWNLVAILVMFVANFVLNQKHTWGESVGKESRRSKSASRAMILFVAAALLLAAPAAAHIAVSQLGYHPDSHKQVVLYDDAAESFSVSQGGSTIFSGALEQRQCQGSQSCLVGDFSAVRTPGTYTLRTDAGHTTTFQVRNTAYASLIPLFEGFFLAHRQQQSPFHADMHTALEPAFTVMADGSFLMEADQASSTLMRLGSAYRKNPSLFSQSSLLDDIRLYAEYLMGLQGVQIDRSQDGMRLSPAVIVSNAFVPGPTDLESITIYAGGQSNKEVAVVSLCGHLDNNEYDQCLAHAAQFYKCQEDEPCLNLTYEGPTGAFVGNDGYGVSKGWSYEFGCFFDADLANGNFNSAQNPCMIFDQAVTDGQTARALLALLQAYPAINDATSLQGSAVLERSEETASYLKDKGARSADVAAWGASMFLLYDYTGDEDYLLEAHRVRNQVSTQFSTDLTAANEYYWEEYVRHRNVLEGAGLAYLVSGQDPVELFTGKMIHDWHDAPRPIKSLGEHVYDVNARGFHNSRLMLLQGVLAAKTAEMISPSQYPFVSVIADQQLAWLSGQNSVQEGVNAGPTRSYSFIFGVGDNPEVFHSRFLVDTGYHSASAGEVIGVRGMDFSFEDPDTQELVRFDGKFSILGHVLGTVGNNWRGEARTEVFDTSRTFNNGLSYIPGWINGAYDTEQDADQIFNYEDKIHSFTFTETTNEIVAAAVELAAYQDARYNDRAAHPLVAFAAPNNNSAAEDWLLSITTSPEGATVFLDGEEVGTAPLNLTLSAGNYSLRAVLEGYSPLTQSVTLTTNTAVELELSELGEGAQIVSTDTNAERIDGQLTLYETLQGLFTVQLSEPGNVTWRINGEVKGTTDAAAEHTFSWTPDILFSADLQRAVVSASTSADSHEWEVWVQDVINPFFSGTTGASTATVHVYTYDQLVSYDEVRVTLNSPTKSTRSYALTAQSAANGFTHWSKALSAEELDYGNNVLVRITGTKDNASEEHTLSATRAHYRQPPQQPSEPTGAISAPSMPRFTPFMPDLVYAVFERDVLGMEESQTVSMDLRSFDNHIADAVAVIVSPDSSERRVNLSLVEGTTGYGTWQGSFSGHQAGHSVLGWVEVTGERGAQDVLTTDEHVVFYVVNQPTGAPQSLGVVFTSLNRNVVESGTEVVLRLDARDEIGITEVNATVVSNRGDEQTFTLQRVEGDALYGTYEGAFLARQADATYRVSNITLSNGQETAVRAVQDREVYVQYLPPDTQGVAATATGQTISVGAVLEHRLAPAIIGGMLMVLAIIAFFTRDLIAGWFRR